MTTVTLKPHPEPGITDAAPVLGKRGGRPPGTFEPRTQWLRGVIREMRRSGHGCADTFRRLCLVEDPGPVPRSFCISDSTADELWSELGADISGQEVTLENFRRLWSRTP